MHLLPKHTPSNQQIITNVVQDTIYDRINPATKKQAATGKRIVERLQASALASGSDHLNEEYELIRGLPNVLNHHYWGGEDSTFRSPKEMTQENRFPPEVLKAVGAVVKKCDDTLSAVNKFVADTTEPEDLPAVKRQLDNISGSAQRLRLDALTTKRQMEILNDTLG